MKDYHDLYLKCEVLLLTNVFEKFRNNSSKKSGLNPSHYFSGLSWNEMLNMADSELELIPDPSMYMFFEKGTRGGISYFSNRYSKASYKYLKSFDPKKESNHIIYLEANNSYGYAMSKLFQKSGSKWIDPKEFNLNQYANNSSKSICFRS